METSHTSNSDINSPPGTCVGKFNNCSTATGITMADSFCVDQNCTIEDVCDTDRFIGHSIDTRPKQYSEIQLPEISDLTTPGLCNKDSRGDISLDRLNNEISVRLACDLNLLDINQNSPRVMINESEEGELPAVHNVNNVKTANVLFNHNELKESSNINVDIAKAVPNESQLKMEDCVFKEETLAKAKSDTHLDNYAASQIKVRKLSPNDLASPSSTNSIRSDVSCKVPLGCRRRNASGNDTGSEDEVLEEGEFPPCDCDECLFGAEQDQPKPPPEERKFVRKVFTEYYFIHSLKYLV